MEGIHIRFGASSSVRGTLLAGALAIALAGPAPARAESVQARESDVDAYAALYGVAVESATAELKLETLAPVLQERLRDALPNTFAGLWIDRESGFRIVVGLTEASSTGDVRALVPADLAPYVEYRAAQHSEAALYESLAAVRDSLGVQANLSLDLLNNRVDVQILESEDRDGVVRGLPKVAVPIHVSLVPTLGKATIDIYGGLDISGCTSGFVVRGTVSGVVTTGVSTAGHCTNTKSYANVNLPYVTGTASGYADAQWHTTPGLTDVPKFKVGTGTRYVYSVYSSTGYAVGQTLCKHGTSSGYACGTITSTSQCPTWISSCQPVFLRIVNCSKSTMSEPGDSGGPVFLGNAAAGHVSGYTLDIACLDRHSLVASKLYLDMFAIGTTVVIAP